MYSLTLFLEKETVKLEAYYEIHNNVDGVFKVQTTKSQ